MILTKLDLLAAMLGVLLFTIYRISLHATRDDNNKFNFGEAFLDGTGKTSMARVCLFGAFIIASWAILAMTVNGDLTEWALGAYLTAFVANGIGSKFADKKEDKNANSN